MAYAEDAWDTYDIVNDILEEDNIRLLAGEIRLENGNIDGL
jgi:hypothetical protein